MDAKTVPTMAGVSATGLPRDEELFNYRQRLQDSLGKFEFDPGVMRRALGKPYSGLNLDSILDTTRRLAALSTGEETEVTDRDAMPNQVVMGPEDLFAERIRLDSGGVRRKYLWTSTLKGNLDHLPSLPLQQQIDEVLTKSGLAQPAEYINPAEILDKMTRVTRMGQGGIPSLDSAPEESRALQPSHFGFIDALRTPESARVGLDVYFASNARKGEDGKIYTRLKNVKTGEWEWKTPEDLADTSVGYPEALKWPTKRVPALKGGKLKFVPRSELAYALPHFEKAFSALNNMVPGKSAVKGQRASMASRMTTQALPLRGGEAPLVQSADPENPDRSYEEILGDKMGVVRSELGGRVTAVTDDEIQVRHDDGSTKTYELYRHHPHGYKTGTHNTPLVAVGDTVQPGGLLAKSNYTTDQGVAALGANLRVMFAPYLGKNFEDAYTVSESAAKRLTSEHYYKHYLDGDPKELRLGLKPFVSLFASKFPDEKLQTLDEEGVVRPGTIVRKGDPLILAAKARTDTQNKVHRKGAPAFSDVSVTWEHDDEGEVVDVVKTKKGPFVLARSYQPLVEGDKIAGRYGNKGVVKIVPDRDMPHDAEGKPFDLIANDLGIISRVNPMQVVEAALGKIAAKTGKVYKVSDFENIEDMREFAERELAKHGMSDLEDVVDPIYGRKIRGVNTGNMFMMKLYHQSEHKGQGRSTGSYTAEGIPQKGGEHGSKRVSLLDSSALLSHGAYKVLRDASVIRGQRNENYWLQFMQGFTPSPPKVPPIYQKMMDSLVASGMNPVRKGYRTHLMELTNADIQERAGDRELKNAETVNFDEDLSPIKGGLFDPELTGSHNSQRWSKITLAEPMLNPVMEEPARRLLGLTQKQLEDVIAGRHSIDGKTGPSGLRDALAAINVPQQISLARQQIARGTKTAREEAIRKLYYLKHADEKGIHPKEWMLDAVPVLPPAFRPVSLMAGQKKVPMVADANLLYKDLFDANRNLVEMQGLVGDDVGDERLAVYSAFKAVTGLGDPVNPKLQEKQVKGILSSIFGTSPKHGVVQQKLIGSAVDQVGRGVVTPNADLDMDTLGIPEAKAWEVFKDFVTRRLRRRGMTFAQIRKEINERSEVARKALVEEMDARPVMMARAPVLHKFGVLAFRPKLTTGNDVQVSPLVVKGLGMDFDGDSCVGSTICTISFPSRLSRIPEIQKLIYSGEDVVLTESEFVPVAGGNSAYEVVQCRIDQFPRSTSPVRVNEKGVEFYSVPEEIKVLSYDSRSGVTGFSPVTEFSIHPDLSGFNVLLSRGTAVGVSDDHSLFAYDVDEATMRRVSPQMSLGMAVPLVRKITSRDVLEQVVIPREVVENANGGKHAPSHRKEIVDVVMADFDFGWWLAASACDAWTDWPLAGGVHYAKQSPQLSEAFHLGCRRLVPELADPRRREESHVYPDMGIEAVSSKSSWSATMLARLFKHWFSSPEGNSAHYKHLPGFFVSLPEDCLWGMLSGFIDGDCCVRINRHPKRKTPQLQCPITTVSRRLKDDVSLLMRLLGIRFGVTEYMKNGSKVYVINPSTIDLWKFRSKVRLKDPDKRDCWQEMPEVTADNFDWVPIPHSIISAVIPSLRKRKDNNYTTAITARSKRKLITRQTAMKWVAMLEEDGFDHADFLPWQDLVQNDTVMWDTVKSIAPLESQTMYDLTVPDTNVFAVQDGLVIYDTVQYHVMAEDDAVKEAYERMLPSRSLISPADMKTPVHMPSQEFVTGLYAASTRRKKNVPKAFRSKQDIIDAYHRGELEIDDQVIAPK